MQNLLITIKSIVIFLLILLLIVIGVLFYSLAYWLIPCNKLMSIVCAIIASLAAILLFYILDRI